MPDPAAQTILLTGITGFIAKRIAADLLARGYAVRGSLRSPKREAEVRAAVGGEAVQDRLSFVSLDLTSDDGWQDAMAGIDALIHTASPFPLEMPKDENELIRPAVDGTLRALKAAEAAGISRVVLTSSLVAVMSATRPKDHVYGPDDWTETDHPTATAYVKSKTLAEQAAWDFVTDHPKMQLTTVNPGLVLGAPLDEHYGSSLQVIERFMAAKDPAVPNVGFPVVDVADVSRLHVEALERPATIGKRVMASESYWTLPELARFLAEAYPERKIATRVAPKLLLQILSLFDPTIKTILPNVGVFTPVDNSATRSLYDMTFILGADSVKASAAAVVKAGG